MKTAISIPDELFHAVEASARRLKVSRSRFYAVAVREFLARQGRATSATDEWNQAIDAAGQPGDEPGARALRKRSRAVLARTGRRRR